MRLPTRILYPLLDPHNGLGARSAPKRYCLTRRGLCRPGSPTRVSHVAVACDRDPASAGFAVRHRRTAGVEDIKGRALDWLAMSWRPARDPPCLSYHQRMDSREFQLAEA